VVEGAGPGLGDELEDPPREVAVPKDVDAEAPTRQLPPAEDTTTNLVQLAAPMPPAVHTGEVWAGTLREQEGEAERERGRGRRRRVIGALAMLLVMGGAGTIGVLAWMKRSTEGMVTEAPAQSATGTSPAEAKSAAPQTPEAVASASSEPTTRVGGIRQPSGAGARGGAPSKIPLSSKAPSKVGVAPTAKPTVAPARLPPPANSTDPFPGQH